MECGALMGGSNCRKTMWPDNLKNHRHAQLLNNINMENFVINL